MTIKNTADGDAVTTETMADRLRFVQTENWRKMRYTDENEEAAWEVYNESLFLQPKAEETEDVEGEGKAKAGEGAERDMEELVPRFGAKWNDKQLLEAVSGIEKPDPEPEPEIKPEPKDKQDAATDVEDGRKPKGKPRGGAAPAAPRRGGRAKASAKTTVTID